MHPFTNIFIHAYIKPNPIVRQYLIGADLDLVLTSTTKMSSLTMRTCFRKLIINKH